MTKGEVAVFQPVHFVAEYDCDAVFREKRKHRSATVSGSSDVFTLFARMPRCPDDEPMVGKRLSK